jgi:zinc protease
MKRAVSVFLLLLSVTFLACAPPRGSVPVPVHPDQLTFEPLVFKIPEVERIVLPNGMRLYFREDRELPLIQVTAMAEAGSISDPVEKTGLGSLFAATMRSGGAGLLNPAELDEALARLAADLSVSTDTYATSVQLSLRATDLPDGLAILADLLRHPTFDPARLDLARKQMVEGIRRQNDHPGTVASNALMRAIYGEHPLGRTPTEESVAAITRDDLVDFHRHYFHPNNMWLAVSGDIDKADLMRELEGVFGDWEQGEFPRQEIPPVTAVPRPVALVDERNIPQTTILIGSLGIDKDNPDLHAVRVMNYILGGGGFNARLMQEIRSNRGLAYSVYSYYQVGRRLPGPFVAGSETKSSSTGEVVSEMKRMMAEMRNSHVSEAELRLARESLVNSFVFGFTDAHAVVTQTMRLDFYDYPPDYLETYRDRVAEVSAEDVLRAARRHLRPEDMTVVLVGDAAVFNPDSIGLPWEPITLER